MTDSNTGSVPSNDLIPEVVRHGILATLSVAIEDVRDMIGRELSAVDIPEDHWAWDMGNSICDKALEGAFDTTLFDKLRGR